MDERSSIYGSAVYRILTALITQISGTAVSPMFLYVYNDIKSHLFDISVGRKFIYHTVDKNILLTTFKTGCSNSFASTARLLIIKLIEEYVRWRTVT